MKKIIIAVDGYSSCGKSTVAKGLAKELGYQYIDSGAMYRSVALYFLRNHIPFLPGQRDTTAIEEALNRITIEFRYNLELKIQETFLNGENVEKEIRQMHVAGHVSKVSTISQVRRFLVEKQQAKGQEKGIVMDGRDIGTVVFPNAELKLFMTADVRIRAQRRFDELLAKGQPADFDLVLKNLEERDYIDSTREDSPLRKADDAIVIDNSYLTPDEQFKLAMSYAVSVILGKKLN